MLSTDTATETGGKKPPGTTSTVEDTADDEEEPFDLYETAAQETEDYLLKSWHRRGTHFEHVVAAVLKAMGCTATVTSASSDHGVDIIAHPDLLGLEQPFVKVQVKSGTGSVGEPESASSLDPSTRVRRASS